MNKNALIAIAVFAGFALLYGFTREKKITVGIKELALKKVSADMVDAISIVGKESLKLSRVNNQWWVEKVEDHAAKKFMADADTVSGFLNAINEIESPYLVTERQDKHEHYQVDDKSGVKIDIFQGGKSVSKFVIGTESDQGRHVRLDGSNEVFGTKGQFFRILKPELKDWRDHRITTAKLDDVKNVVLSSADRPDVEVSYNRESKQWHLVNVLDKNFRLDEKKASQIAESLIRLKAKDFVAQGQDADKVNGMIKSTPYSAKVFFGHDKVQAIKLVENKENNKYYAKIDGQDEIFEVSGFAFKDLTAKIEDLRDMHIIAFEPENIERMTMDTNKGTIVVEKNDNQWRIKEPKTLPDGFEFDTDRFLRYLRQIQDLRADRLATSASEKSAAVKTGSSIRGIELTEKGGEKKRLQFGGLANGKEVYVKSVLDDQLYVLNSKNLESFDKGIELFRRQAEKKLDVSPDMRKQIEEAIKKYDKDNV